MYFKLTITDGKLTPALNELTLNRFIRPHRASTEPEIKLYFTKYLHIQALPSALSAREKGFSLYNGGWDRR